MSINSAICRPSEAQTALWGGPPGWDSNPWRQGPWTTTPPKNRPLHLPYSVSHTVVECRPVLHPSLLYMFCPASDLTCIRPVLHLSSPASDLSCIRPLLHLSCPASAMFCLEEMLFLNFNGFSDAQHISKFKHAKETFWWNKFVWQLSTCEKLISPKSTQPTECILKIFHCKSLYLEVT